MSPREEILHFVQDDMNEKREMYPGIAVQTNVHNTAEGAFVSTFSGGRHYLFRAVTVRA